MKSKKLKGKWIIKQIDDPGVKGYVIQGRLGPDQPLEPFNPFEPRNPLERRPIPQRPFRNSENINEVRKPLTDIFEEEKAVKIYVELLGEEKEDIRLNVKENKVEVKAKNFYKMIEVPGNVETEKASAKYNNGVLTVTIPKKKPSEKEKQKIRID